MANNVLELKGQKFIQEPKGKSTPSPSMNGHKEVTSEHLYKLRISLPSVKKACSNKEFIS